MLGGLCVGAGRIYNNRNNILLSAGILFVAAGTLLLLLLGLFPLNAPSDYIFMYFFMCYNKHYDMSM